MKSFEQMYSEFYGAEINDAAQIQLYSHSGTELKEFVNYCIEQAGINTVLCTVASEGEEKSVSGGRCEKCSDYGIIQDEHGRNSNCECHY